MLSPPVLESRAPDIIIKKCEINRDKKRAKVINLSLHQQNPEPKLPCKRTTILQAKEDEETNTPPPPQPSENQVKKASNKALVMARIDHLVSKRNDDDQSELVLPSKQRIPVIKMTTQNNDLSQEKSSTGCINEDEAA